MIITITWLHLMELFFEFRLVKTTTAGKTGEKYYSGDSGIKV